MNVDAVWPGSSVPSASCHWKVTEAGIAVTESVAVCPGVMVGDLEAQEFVNGEKRLGVFRSNVDARSFFRGLHLVFDHVAQRLHPLRARRVLRVNEHGRGKISCREHRYDVPKM